jgi:hypothetical protein
MGCVLASQMVNMKRMTVHKILGPQVIPGDVFEMLTGIQLNAYVIIKYQGHTYIQFKGTIMPRMFVDHLALYFNLDSGLQCGIVKMSEDTCI